MCVGVEEVLDIADGSPFKADGRIGVYTPTVEVQSVRCCALKCCQALRCMCARDIGVVAGVDVDPRPVKSVGDGAAREFQQGVPAAEFGAQLDVDLGEVPYVLR